jgi:hypothetical protein
MYAYAGGRQELILTSGGLIMDGDEFFYLRLRQKQLLVFLCVIADNFKIDVLAKKRESLLSLFLIPAIFTGVRGVAVDRWKCSLLSAARRPPDGLGCEHCCSDGSGEGGNLLCCAGCKAVYYCSKECQLANWKAEGHKSFCLIRREFLKQQGALS